MKQFVILFALMASSSCVFAANILWGQVFVKDGDVQSLCIEKTDTQPYLFTGYTVGVSIDQGIATLTANPNGRLLIPGGGWLEALVGDWVDAETMLNQASYFENGHIDGLSQGQTEHSIAVGVNTENYLKFVIHDSEQEFAYYDGSRTEIPDCYYGWARYTVDENGKIYILESALDLDGGAIRVGGGAVPEPSSGLLFFLGMTCFLLKRRLETVRPSLVCEHVERRRTGHLGRRALFLVAAFLAWGISVGVKGASVEWGISHVDSEQKESAGSAWLLTIGQPYLNIKADSVGGGLFLTAIPDANLVSGNTFARAAEGDVVSADYMAAKGSYFAWAQRDDPDAVRADYSIFLDGSENVYLAFIADYGAYDTVRYGWLELGLDERGMLKVYASAWDLDGDAITVGAIPEPASGLLALIGVAACALRRRRPAGGL